ncbi:NAD(P)-binding domain protein [Moelleriella libera RCEF 2490]|uniref:NAD(P)-binding domain protein n=1 Tax=Moelleriella libera RCEF 2490 TaxID=1081109 RepID=A0A167ZPK5_9HYPO|nr:NAD(P)-binding domain protein [Moelleriella libera RCEF 2490]
MAVVAVSGGTGDLGRTIVSAIADAGRHNVIVLSRATSTASTADGEPKRVSVDYSNVEQLSSVLRAHGVSVVVAALLLADDASTQSQINLIRAAALSGTIKKFIPTEYHLDYNVPITGVDIAFAPYQLECEEELKRHPELTYTLIRNGLFLDYLAMPYGPMPTNLKPLWLFLDLPHQRLVIPGDGTDHVVFTHTADLAACIERLVALPVEQWPREALLQGNRIQVKDLVEITRRISGREFAVSWEARDAIRSGRHAVLPSNEAVFAQPSSGQLFRELEREVLLTTLGGGYENLQGQDLAEMLPDVSVTDLETFLRRAWETKEKEQLSTTNST